MQLDHRIAETQEVFQVQLDERISTLVDECIGAQLGLIRGFSRIDGEVGSDWCEFSEQGGSSVR